MVKFDQRLTAIAECPILDVPPDDDGTPNGGILYDPHPVITASNDLVLTHELCHKFGGKYAYDLFLTAIKARHDNELFKWVLNALYDWYHEYKYKEISTLISTNLMWLRKNHQLKQTEDEALNKLVHILNNEVPMEVVQKLFGMNINDEIDLIVLADRLSSEITKVPTAKVASMLAKSRPGGLLAGGSKNNFNSELSDYYTTAVSKYYNIIKRLSSLWTANKYGWHSTYYGEINWRNLPLLLLGDSVGLPVFRLMAKNIVNRSVYVVIDRSGSTCGISDTIMDTAVIITESLRMIEVPVSILDVGVTDSIINNIREPIDRKWFTPMAKGTTPIGDVLLQINESNPDSLLVIITDGNPDSWEKLHAGLRKFKGEYFSLVIGNSYVEYMKCLRNVIPVEPHTIIRSLLANEQRILSKNSKRC